MKTAMDAFQSVSGESRSTSSKTPVMAATVCRCQLWLPLNTGPHIFGRVDQRGFYHLLLEPRSQEVGVLGADPVCSAALADSNASRVAQEPSCGAKDCGYSGVKGDSAFMFMAKPG